MCLFSPLQRLWEEHVFLVKNCVFFQNHGGLSCPHLCSVKLTQILVFGVMCFRKPGGTVPRKWTKVPWKGTILKRKVVFQALFLRWQDMYCSIFGPVGSLQNRTSYIQLENDQSRATAMVTMVRPSGRSRLLVLFLGLRDMENFVGICVGEKWTLQQTWLSWVVSFPRHSMGLVYFQRKHWIHSMKLA